MTREERNEEMPFSTDIEGREGKPVYMADFVMEAMLGRPLKPNEWARPINGDVFDCRRVNLELVTD